MTPGYLCIETNEARPGLVRLIVDRDLPDAQATAGQVRQIRFVARFNDSEAALMHTHEILKRRLLDPDSHLYRAPIERAIAAVESLALTHRPIYRDAGLSTQQQAQIDRYRQTFERYRWYKERFFEVMGYIGIGLLLFNLFVLSLP